MKAARTTLRSAGVLGWCLTGALGCTQADEPPWSPQELRVIFSLSPPPTLAPSPGNRVADDDRAAQLGRHLFFDKGLSSNGQVACASCHDPIRHFTDGRQRARGVADTARNAPTIIGAPNAPFLFHDGRKDSLWAQALGPLENDAEHAFDRTAAVHHVAAHHRARYEAVFGPMPTAAELAALPAHARPRPLDSRHPQARAWAAMTELQRATVTRVFVHLGKAIEAYERKLVPLPGRFDRYVAALRTRDPSAAQVLSAQERRGLRAFIGVGGCVNCHNGPALSDQGFHNLGLPAAQGVVGVDGGRSVGADQVRRDEFRCGTVWSDATPTTAACQELRFLNPLFEDFLGAFKTPSLRNVARTAPYMHAGQFATLEEVVRFYQTLPGRAQVGHREWTLRPLPGSVVAADLVAFLQTLTGPLPDARWLGPGG
ncbi:MAG: cytochrome-c peroxidase [Deltaproteobacteria bacterium]|nr:cytochrome-c peroxidase [Deltaproteobacteria bacterium]